MITEAQTDLQALQARRLRAWRQTPETRIPDADAAAQLIVEFGVATLFPASPEVPNLYHAYVGDPEAKAESEWDSPAGEVYSWRWILGRREAGFYTAIVCGRPTWVSWELLPAVIRLCGELRTPDELFDSGVLSGNAYRLAQALEESDGVLSTGDLRRLARFPTGKDQRNAYLKAMAELDTRLLVAKVFSENDEDMRHTLVVVRYPQAVAAAEAMTREEALQRLLLAYLPHALYAVPAVLARHLKIPEAELVAGLDRLLGAQQVATATVEGHKRPIYVWTGSPS